MNVENRAYRIEERDRSGSLANVITLTAAAVPLDLAAAELIAGALQSGTEYTAGWRTLEILPVATPEELLAEAVAAWRASGLLMTSPTTMAAALRSLAESLDVLGDVELPAQVMLDVQMTVPPTGVSAAEQSWAVEMLSGVLGLAPVHTTTPYGAQYGTPYGGGVSVTSNRSTYDSTPAAGGTPSAKPVEPEEADPVWMAAKRSGTDYHQLKRPISATSQTLCGRSTRTGVRLSEVDAADAGGTPCTQCASKAGGPS